MRIEPEWVGELLGQWALRDWADARQELGYPRVSPMFSRAVHGRDADDAMGYSAAEIQAVVVAVEWLQAEHPDHWRAVSREFKAWTRATLEQRDNDHELVAHAAKLIAKKIDQLLP
jgi:hypothetical protein